MDNQLDSEETLGGGQSILILFVVIICGFIASQIAAAIALIPFLDLNDISSIQEKLGNPSAYPEMKFPLLLSQGVSSIVLFIITPIIYIRMFKIDGHQLLGTKINTSGLLLVLAGCTTVMAFPLISIIYEWNMTWNIPGDFGIWAKKQEEQMKVITEFLLKVDNLGELLLSFIVIAVVAGIGEELLFRGLIQTHLGFSISNPDVVIWITAILFGLFHFQFYGIVPRIMLGALMGYLFYWSGSIKYSMMAHIFNNGFQVVTSYFLAMSGSGINIDEEVTFPIYVTIGSLLLTAATLFYLKNQFSKNAMAGGV